MSAERFKEFLRKLEPYAGLWQSAEFTVIALGERSGDFLSLATSVVLRPQRVESVNVLRNFPLTDLATPILAAQVEYPLLNALNGFAPLRKLVEAGRFELEVGSSVFPVRLFGIPADPHEGEFGFSWTKVLDKPRTEMKAQFGIDRRCVALLNTYDSGHAMCQLVTDDLLQDINSALRDRPHLIDGLDGLISKLIPGVRLSMDACPPARIVAPLPFDLRFQPVEELIVNAPEEAFASGMRVSLLFRPTGDPQSFQLGISNSVGTTQQGMREWQQRITWPSGAQSATAVLFYVGHQIEEIRFDRLPEFTSPVADANTAASASPGRYAGWSPQPGESERTEGSGNMGLDLSSAEQVVITALGGVHPQKVHLHQLAARIVPPLERGALLRAVEALYSRSLIMCKPLKGNEGLEDAANILLSSEGVKWLKESASSKNSPAVVKVLKVLIASPSDVTAERDAVESAIREWNTNHHEGTGIMLDPVRWETHSYPAMGDRPQGILNKQIVKSAHFLIGIFGNRLGTPTGEVPSGTIEEIEEIRKSGRHVALYFSNAPVPQDADRAQLDALENYRRSLQGLYFKFGSADELRRLVTGHLPKIVDDVWANLKSTNAEVGTRKPASVTQPQMKLGPAIARRFADEFSTNDDLSPKELELLWTAGKSSDGEIYHSSTLDGEGIRANKRHFLLGADARTASEWLSALRGLENRGLIEPVSDDRTFFKVTGEGYVAADKLEEFARWNAHSIILRAYYINADTQEIRLACQGIIALPATYYPDQTAADGSVQRSLKESRSLLVEGLGSMPRIDWQPTDVEFTDDDVGKVETFRVDGMQYIRPSRLKLPIISA